MRRFTRTATVLLVGLGAGVLTPVTARAQSEAEAVMVAAAKWAKRGLPSGPVRLDPYRSGRSGEQAARRVASALGAELGTLEDTRRCTDVMDPSSCRLDAAVLLAIAPPKITRDEARVRIYAWYRQSSAREPVGKRSWDLTLRRSGGGWQVVEPHLLD